MTVKISPTLDELKKLEKSVFSMLDDEWMLVTAGDLRSFNTMTASWGGFGILWNKPVAFVFVRPTRHTFNFMETSEVFTLTFFEEKYRKVLQFCGSRSGRDTDKIKATGLIPIESPSGSVIFDQTYLAFDCRKLYTTDIDPAHFLDSSIEKNYPKKDYHRMYIGEITHYHQKSIQ
jgi:flavin reductase (DIM6/NTAB) family NADH-FMN oxidoreductase RutF